MRGSQINTLTLYTDFDGSRTDHWTKTGDQGSDWLTAEVEIDVPSSTTQVDIHMHHSLLHTNS